MMKLVLLFFVIATIASNLESVNVTFAYPNNMKFRFDNSDNNKCISVKCPSI